jgi:hypothetical protein
MTHALAMQGGGTLTWEERGPYIHLTACRPLQGDDLYKVWLQGQQGEFLLGTMIPEEGQLRLARTVSRNTLQTGGCWPAVGVRCTQTAVTVHSNAHPPQSCWRWEHFPAHRLTDPVLTEAACAWGAILFRQEVDGFSFAAPFDPRRPFPYTPVFCLATISMVDLHPHVILRFTQDGKPRLPSC